MLSCLWDGAHKRTLAANQKAHVVAAVGSSLSEWSFSIFLIPYNHKQNGFSSSLNKLFPSFMKKSNFNRIRVNIFTIGKLLGIMQPLMSMIMNILYHLNEQFMSQSQGQGINSFEVFSFHLHLQCTVNKCKFPYIKNRINMFGYVWFTVHDRLSVFCPVVLFV